MHFPTFGHFFEMFFFLMNQFCNGVSLWIWWKSGDRAKSLMVTTPGWMRCFRMGSPLYHLLFFCHLMTHVNGASFVQWPNVIRTFPSFSYSFFISVVCFMLYIWMLKCQWLLEWVSCRETAQFKCRWTVQQTAAADPSQLHLYIQKPSRKRERDTVSQSIGE